MAKSLRYATGAGVLGVLAFGWAAGCSSNNGVTPNPPAQDAGNSGDSAQSTPTGDGSTNSVGDSAVSTGDGGPTYTLIDDMEMTTHGPIELTGIVAPESPGYWFNFGGTATGDTLVPPYTLFAFSALPSPTTTLNGTVSKHAAHQVCALNGQYDVCGEGFEFAQVPDLDAGTADAGAMDAAIHDAGIHDGGDAGGPPMTTVPFDISQYKGITFWGKAGGADAGGLDIKVLFPDTDTDPRGGVCNGPNSGASGPTDLSQCFNSYAEHVTLTGDWQQFTVLFADVNFSIDSTFGLQACQPGGPTVCVQPWSGKSVYGINWQGQDNNVPDSGTLGVDFWVDDVYFVK